MTDQVSQVSRLCFGTSTFVAGRLRPEKDSGPGIETLTEALRRGVRYIHSNPKLGTQWAIRRAVGQVGSLEGIRHIIKVEAALGLALASLRAELVKAIFTSCDLLHVQRLDMVTLEVDIKRTSDPWLLTDSSAVRAWYATSAEIVIESGMVDGVLAYCHSPAHLSAALPVNGVSGFSAQFNVAEPWPALYLERIANRNQLFVGMSPLGRGALLMPSSNVPERLRAIRWALCDRRVHLVVVCMSSLTHFEEVLEAASEPLPFEEANSTAKAWLARIEPQEQFNYAATNFIS